jgi:predicted phage terminase large subunit-like protein
VASGDDGEYYVLEAFGVRLSPEGWAKRALDTLDRYRATDIKAESNQGGEMVKSVIKKVRPGAPVNLIRALKSKTLRAEPVALLYEQGRVHHVGTLADAEDQMCSFPVAAEHDDILDAIVHGINELHSRAGGLMVSFV